MSDTLTFSTFWKEKEGNTVADLKFIAKMGDFCGEERNNAG